MFQDRVKPGIRQLREWINTGVVGKPLLVDARMNDTGLRNTTAARAGAGPSRWMVAAHWSIRRYIPWIYCCGCWATWFESNLGWQPRFTLLEFASGALGVLQATTAAYPGYPRRVEITGTEGTVILEQDHILAANLRNPASLIGPGAPDENESASSAVVSDARGQQALFEDFLRAIEQNTAPVCDGREGRRSIALVEAIYRAARDGGPVSVSPDKHWI
jgi:predicted dehydrogenase